MESCRFPERPYLKNKVKSDTVRHLTLTSDPHIHIHTETNRQMHARTHMCTRRDLHFIDLSFASNVDSNHVSEP